MSDAPREGRRRPLPFGLHQGLEYLVGILVALTAIRLPSRAATLGLAVAVVVVALPLVSDGPLGGFRLLGRAVHRALDVLLIMLLAVSPVFLGGDDVTTLVLAETLAVIYAALVVRTSYAPPKRRRGGSAPPTPASTPATTPTIGAGAAPTVATPPPIVADALRSAGHAVGKVGRQGPRALGRIVGRRTRR